MTAPRRIWLCADDYGLSPGVNRGIRDLLARGRINATSVMVVTPTFNSAEAEALAKLNSDGRIAIGLHVTLTEPFGPLTKDYAPLKDGKFLSIADTFKAGFFRRLDRDMLTREVAAQIEAFFAAFGTAPDFVDCHQHAHLFPIARDAVLQAAKDAAPEAWLRQCGRITLLHRRLADPKGLVLDVLSSAFRRRAQSLGLATNPAFAGTYDFAPHRDFAALFPGFLDSLPPDSVVMCHPGFVDDELRRLDWVTTQREREYAYFAGDAFSRDLQAHNVTLR